MLIVNFPGHQDRCWAGIQTRYCSPGRRQQRECAAGEREGQETPRTTAKRQKFLYSYPIIDFACKVLGFIVVNNDGRLTEVDSHQI
jgi:6-phosphogluconolactonase (cycloisomerase 2 family)